MSDFPCAIDYFVDRSRVFQNQNSHKAIVLHGTGGSASQTVEQLGEWFRTNVNKASTHYGIGREGRIAQYVFEQDGAAGNCCIDGNYDRFWDQFGGDNLNVHTLSVETVNDSANSLPLTEPQKVTLFKLVKYWVDKYHIPLTHIKSHASIDPVLRGRCPGQNFPWTELFAYLSGQQEEEQPMEITLATPGVSQFFEGTDTSWKCKANGLVIDHGGLTFYRKFGNSGLCGLTHMGLPRSQPLGVTGKPGVIYQRFERVVLVYDKDRQLDRPVGAVGDFYLSHIDQFPGLDPRVEQLKAENADLKEQLETGKVITPEIADGINVVFGNAQKLKTDAGV